MARHAAPREPVRLPGWGMAGALLAVGLVGPLLTLGAETVADAYVATVGLGDEGRADEEA